MKISISIAQIQILLKSPQANFEKAAQLVADAAQRGSNLIVLPELWISGYDLEHHEVYTQSESQTISKIQGLADHHNISIHGSILHKDKGYVNNTAMLFTPGQQFPACYNKIHLFRLMNEHLYLKPGSRPVLMQCSWEKTGAAICYDLRFPELFRWYALNGAQLILINAEWPLKRIEHWRILLQARAVENQIFIAAANNVGKTGSEEFGGCSAILDPQGNFLIEGSSHNEELLTAVLDLEQIHKARKNIPVFNDRRPDIYGNLTP